MPENLASEIKFWRMELEQAVLVSYQWEKCE